MFLLDIQGDAKGLSVGGMVIITKSLSLTVKPWSLFASLYACFLFAKMSIFTSFIVFLL